MNDVCTFIQWEVVAGEIKEHHGLTVGFQSRNPQCCFCNCNGKVVNFNTIKLVQ